MKFIDSGEYIRLDKGQKISQPPKLPVFPLQTVIIIHGEPYDFIFGTEDLCQERITVPWTVWTDVWNSSTNSFLDKYLMTWFPEKNTCPKERAVEKWHWKGVTEVFSLQECGCCLKDVFLHAGYDRSVYTDFLRVKPKEVCREPLVMHYENIMCNCLEYLNGKFLLGHGRHNNILTKYDAVIEITVANGRLSAVQDVTELVKNFKSWLVANQGATEESIQRSFPEIAAEHSFWYK